MSLNLEDVKILNVTYSAKHFTFDVEYVNKNGQHLLKRLNPTNFPNHEGVSVLNRKFQINSKVLVWLKSLDELKKLGYQKNEDFKHLIAHPDSPYSLGKRKQALLGLPALNGFIGVTEKWEPVVVIPIKEDKRFRFCEKEIKHLISNQPKLIKRVQVKDSSGNIWVLGEDGSIASPQDYLPTKKVDIIIDLLRKSGKI